MRDGAPPPDDLVLHDWCEKYHALPDAGGLFDQDYFRMMRMSVLANVHNAYARLRNMVGEQIHSLSEGDRRVLRSLRDLGLLYA